MLAGEPDAGNLQVRFDEGEQRDWRKPPVALYTTLVCVAKLGGGLRWFALEATLLLIGWGLVTTSGYLAFHNNVSNLIHGQPLHQHENQPSK